MKPTPNQHRIIGLFLILSLFMVRINRKTSSSALVIIFRFFLPNVRNFPVYYDIISRFRSAQSTILLHDNNESLRDAKTNGACIIKTSIIIVPIERFCDVDICERGSVPRQRRLRRSQANWCVATRQNTGQCGLCRVGSPN